MSLPACTLCQNSADPRMGLMTRDGHYYPLCDGCAPWPWDSVEAIRGTADLCRSRLSRTSCDPLGPFGFNEPLMCE